MRAIDFWTKFFSFLILFPVSGFVASVPNLYIVSGILAILLCIGRINLREMGKRGLVYILPLTIFILLSSLAFLKGNLYQKMMEGLILSLRFVILIGFGMLFALSTDLTEIPQAFFRVKLPHRYGMILMVAYRLWPLMLQKFEQIALAQQARGACFHLQLNRLPTFFKSLMALVVPLVYASLESSVGLSETLICRGYNPYGKITVPPRRYNFADLILMGLSLGLLIWVIF